MLIAPPAPREEQRLALLQSLDLLDSPAEPLFDRITRVLAQALGTSMALVSLVDRDRQWFKSRHGIEATELGRDVAFCAHTILGDDALVVRDARRDRRFADNPLVTGGPCLRFYAGMPILSAEGLALGTLCALDARPLKLGEQQLGVLRDLAGLVQHELQRREAALAQRKARACSDALLDDHEARLRAAFELNGVGMALVAPDGGWLKVNRALCRIVGYSEAELRRLTFQDLTFEDDLHTDLELLAQLDGGEIEQYSLEKRYRRKDGTLVWGRLTVAACRSRDGSPRYYISAVEDIDSRKRAEAALQGQRHDLERRLQTRSQDLRETNEQLSRTMRQQLSAERALRASEAQLRSVLDHARDAYVCIDADGIIVDWNHQAERTFGWSRLEAVGRLLENTILPPRYREAHRQALRRHVESGTARTPDQRLRLPALRRDGSSFAAEIRIAAIEHDGRSLFGAFVHELTERSADTAPRASAANPPAG